MFLKRILLVVVLCVTGWSFGQSLDYRIGDLNLGSADFDTATCLQLPIFLVDTGSGTRITDLTMTLRFSGDLNIIDVGKSFEPLVANAFIGQALTTFATGIRNPGVDLTNSSGTHNTECDNIVNQATEGGEAVDFDLGIQPGVGGSWTINNQFAEFVVRGFVVNLGGVTITETTGEPQLIGVLEIPLKPGLDGMTNAQITVSTESGDNFNFVTLEGGGQVDINLPEGNEGRIDFCTTPVITEDPVGTSTCEGGDVTLAVGTELGGMGYQWFHDGFAIDGATGASLSLNDVTIDDDGSYHVEVTGCGGVTVASAAAVVDVFDPVVIDSISDDVVACFAQEIILEVTASGHGIQSYQWYRNGQAVGGDSSIYVIDNAQTSDSGFYTCEIIAECGNVTSTQVRVIVADFFARITPNLVAQGVHPVTLFSQVFCNITPVTYEWISQGNVVGTDATLPLELLTQTREFTLRVTDEGSNVRQATAVVLVHPNPQGSDPNGDNENTEDDVHFVCPDWGGVSDFEVDEDGFFTILDMLYINTGN